MDAAGETRTLQRKYALAHSDCMEARAQLAKLEVEKAQEMEKFAARNAELDKWVADTQAELETEKSGRIKLEGEIETLHEKYWEESRKNFEGMEKKISAYEEAIARLTGAEEEYKTKLRQFDEAGEKTNAAISDLMERVGVAEEARKKVGELESMLLKLDSKHAEPEPEPGMAPPGPPIRRSREGRKLKSVVWMEKDMARTRVYTD